jgi:hypothetical protein
MLPVTRVTQAGIERSLRAWCITLPGQGWRLAVLLAPSWRTGAVELVSLAGRAAGAPSPRPCAAGSVLFIVRSQLGLACNARILASMGWHVAPAIGWAAAGGT